MARKFREEASATDLQVMPLGVSLDAYVAQVAPDVLGSLPIMASASTLEYFKRLFEQQKSGEQQSMGKSIVIWPYATRLIVLARAFRALTQDQQQFVVNARKEQIFWRGEDLGFFNTVITETILYRDLDENEKAAYRKKLMAVAANMAQRHAMF